MCSILRYPYFSYFISSFVILAMANLPLFGKNKPIRLVIPSLEYLRRKHIEYSNYSNQNLNS